MKCKCGNEAKIFFKKINNGNENEVWFQCEKCGRKRQNYCQVCQNLLVVDEDGMCTICGA